MAETKSAAPTLSAAATPAPTKNGRKSKLPISDKIALLRAELAQAEADAREAQKAKAMIVGTVVIDTMEENPNFAREVVALLRTKVKGARDKATIADLIL